jgi:hypothetical protein
MAIDTITTYLNIPLSHALAAQFGAKLETLTAPDKLDIAHAILTTIAWGDNQGEAKTVGATIEEFGTVMDNAQQSEQAFTILDAHSTTSTQDLLGLVALLCLHLQTGVYADAQ